MTRKLAYTAIIFVAIILLGCAPTAEPTVTPVPSRPTDSPAEATTIPGSSVTPTVLPKPAATDAPQAPASAEGERIESRVGYIFSTQPMAQFDDYFESPNGDRFGITGIDETVQADIDAARDSGELVGISGILYSEAMDVRGVQIIADLVVPFGEEEINGWTGTLHSTEKGVQFNDFFTLTDDQSPMYGSTSFGIHSMDETIRTQLDNLRDTDEVFAVSGTLRRLVPDAYGFQIEVTELVVGKEVFTTSPVELLSYENTEYGFSLPYPANWTVDDRPAEDPGAGRTYAAAVEFAGDDVRLVIQVRAAGSDNVISFAPGAGTWDKRGTINIAGTDVMITPLVSGGTTKEIYYGSTTGFSARDLDFGVSLSSTSQADYDSIDLDADTVTIVERMLKSLTIGEEGEAGVWWGTVLPVHGSVENNTYIDDVFGFGFEYPASMRLMALEPEEGEARALELSGNDIRLIIYYHEAGDDAVIRFGPGAGELEERGQVIIGGMRLPRVAVVSDDKIKEIYYGGLVGPQLETTHFGLMMAAAGEGDYDSLALTDEQIAIGDAIVQSLTLDPGTGTSEVIASGAPFLFQHQIYAGQIYEIIPASSEINEILVDIAGNGETIHVWGQVLEAGETRPRLKINRIQLQEVRTAPEVVSSDVESWEGAIVKTVLGNQSDLYFQREDGQQFGIAADENTADTLGMAAWTGARILVSGTLNEPVPDHQGRQIIAHQIEFLENTADHPRNLSLFATANASSTLTEGKKTFSPAFAIDGDAHSCWVEGVEGTGEGEWLQLDFPGEIEIEALNVVIGFNEPKELYPANARPSIVELVAGDQSIKVTLKDTLAMQNVYLQDAELKTDSLLIRIVDVYEGTDYTDTCLAEFQVWGYVVAE